MNARPGVVYLVGAGPGDPGLITARALELIASADVILHDRLIPAAALDGARPDAEILYVGKEPGRASVPQDQIEQRLIAEARAGRSVVRLKGGDPFVFGRGGEEAEALAEAAISFEVVPGVTAGVAAPAYAGIPVTHRDDASAVAFVTGHEDPHMGGSGLDWEALASFPGTLVVYMGVKRLREIVACLTEAGRDPNEPAAAVEGGTLPGQRVVTATLAQLPKAAAEADLQAPSILLFGPVAARREAISWLERRPLHGRRVVVTRARAQASGLAATLRTLGADVIELPAIRIEPLIDSPAVTDAVDDLHSYALVCFTSPNGVRLLFEAMAAQGRDARALANATVAAVGPGTANRPVLVARPAEARDVLPDALRERGARVDVVVLYETLAEEPEPEALEAARDADYVTFTSSSTVRNLLGSIGDEFPRAARVASIGPVTSAAAREAGLEVHVEASRHDPSGLVDAVLDDAAGR
jgi:uroporphyrinogen III methyltransferase/synthase